MLISFVGLIVKPKNKSSLMPKMEQNRKIVGTITNLGRSGCHALYFYGK